MPIDRLYIYPTGDIHLLLTAGADMQIELWGEDENGKLHNVADNASTRYMNFDTAVVSSNDKGKFSAVAAGSTLGRILYNDITDPGNIIVSELIIRIFVHDAIEELWIGNNRASVHAGESNYVLSVFAKFTDGVIGDISSHPYLNFSSANPAALSINNTNDKGRITGINSGAPAVALTVSHNGKSDTINGFVRESLTTTTRPILKRIHGTGNYKDRRNILILPEGFTASQSDKDLFERVVQEIKHNFFDTNTHSPYDILKDSFNLWVAFDSGAEPGVTIRNPVATDGTPIPSGYTDAGPCDNTIMSLEELIEFVGLPDANAPDEFLDIQSKWGGISGLNLSRVNEDLFKLWKKQIISGITQAKDTVFGLAIGARFGERFSDNEITPNSKIKKWLANSFSARHITPDARRVDKLVAGANFRSNRLGFLIKYLKSLRFGTDQSHPNFEVHKTWTETDSPKDLNFISFILNESTYGGTNFGPFATTLGHNETIPVFTITGHPLKLDHLPNFVPTSMDVGEIDPLRLTHAIGHEFAHSMKLGDEYDGYDDPAHTSFINTPVNTARFKRFLNLSHFFELANASNKIVADKIRWNWHRIKQVALTVTAAVDSGTDKVRVRVKPGEGAKWQEIKTKNEKVFLRIAAMNTDAADRSKGIDGPFTISGITADSSGDLLELKGRTRTVEPNIYPARSILFLPLTDDAGNILMTIDPKVIARINSTGEPFHKNTNCATCHNGASFPPTDIAGFKYPPNHFEVIALYEGAGTFNCRAFRPAGMCQMRGGYFDDKKITRLSGFSFVAKYVMVNQTDPLMLPKLNPLYPGA